MSIEINTLLYDIKKLLPKNLLGDTEFLNKLQWIEFDVKAGKYDEDKIPECVDCSTTLVCPECDEYRKYRRKK